VSNADLKSWLPAATLNGLCEAETWRRGEVRPHFQMLERFRKEKRRSGAEQLLTL
jgi:hypothetical protein